MKHIRTFEGSRKKLNNEIELRKKYNNLIPGMYIIFSYSRFYWKLRRDVNYLIIGRLLKNNERRTFSDGQGNYYDEYTCEIEIIDYISDTMESYAFGQNDIFYNKDFNLEKIKIFYSSSSFNDVQDEYNKTKQKDMYLEWIDHSTNADINKYNI